MLLFVAFILLCAYQSILCSDVIPKDIWIDFDETISYEDTTEHFASIIDPNSVEGSKWKEILEKYEVLHLKHREMEWSDEFFSRRNCQRIFRDLNPNLNLALDEAQKAVCQMNIAENYWYYLLDQAETVFKGFTVHQLFEHGKKVPKLHEHAGETIQKFINSGFQVQLLSLHWSRWYIYGALSQHQVDHERLRVHSNNLYMGSDGRSSGRLRLCFINGIDKLRFFQNSLDEKKRACNYTPQETVFIGDSINDIPSMCT
ncbi:hypothetical protein HMI55_001965 [Coelomomyces lativittatus]|nr:hypothetical protein HMI55_001965 [Coelomomyces lativittatus]